MKKFLLLLLFYPILLGSGPYITANGEPQVEGPITVYGVYKQILDGVLSQSLQQTVEDITLYVRTTGADTNDCLTVGTACLTIQKAVLKIPKEINNAVIVDVGEGNFAGFMLSSFVINHPSGSLLLRGAYKTATISTGTVSGTTTSGTTLTMEDTGQAWTVNDLRSKLIKINGEYRYILSNTATEVSFLGPFTATTNLKAYEIVEHGSVLTSLCSSNVYGMIESIGCLSGGNTLSKVFSVDNFQVNGQSGWYETIWNWEGQALSVSHIHGFDNYWGAGWEHIYGRFYVSDVWLEDGGTATAPMLYVNYSGSAQFNRVMAEGSSSTGISVGVTKDFRGNYIYANSNTVAGLKVEMVGLTNLDYLFCTGNTEYGLYVYHSDVTQFGHATLTGNGIGAVSFGSGHFDFDAGLVVTGNTGNGIEVSQATRFVDIDSGTISDNGGYGIYVDENGSGNRTAGSFINLAGTITIENNTLGGVILNNNSGAAFTAVSGTNTGYGLVLEVGSHAIVTTDTAITGSTGDATINDGATTLTWSTDFAADGDSAVNLDSGSRILRKD